MKFTKMHGIGNDYVYVNCFEETVENPSEVAVKILSLIHIQEIIAEEAYVEAYIHFLLGNVIKCDSIGDLRQQKIGVTAECMLYRNFQLRRLNPDSYTRQAFIGEKSMQKRRKELQEHLEELYREKEEYDAVIEDARRLSGYEYLSRETEEYMDCLLYTSGNLIC